MKKVGIVLLACLVIILVGIGYLFLQNDKDSDLKEKEVIKEENKILSGNVVASNDIKLYELDNGKYRESGIVGSGEILNIVESHGDYYKVGNIIGDYYIDGNGVVSSNDNISYSDRYKSYIVFNKNVNTIDKTILYDEDGKLVYEFYEEMTFPIIINNTDKYGVEFNDRLLYVKNSDNVNIVDSNNTLEKNTKGIGVLNYHFFYDETILEKRKECNQEICASKGQFKMHLDYIKDNNFLALTMNELEMYIDGKIRLPKSVVITIDDGWLAELGIQMLNEYKLNATIFLVTSIYNPSDFKTDYVEVHSHSHNMHNGGDCPVGQGGGIQCLDEEVILNDLKTSSDILNGSKVFCYPFYEYNNYSIEMLKKAGYKMAFAGESYRSDNLVKVGSDKYRLPRFVVVNYTTMKDFTNYLNGLY